MRITILLCISLFYFSTCNTPQNGATDGGNTAEEISGDYDNFLQVWKQNTKDNLHRDTTGIEHDHIHIKIQALDDVKDGYNFSFFSGRNNATKLGEERIQLVSVATDSSDIRQVVVRRNGPKYTSTDGSIDIHGDTLWTNGLGIYDLQDSKKYRLIRCRYFSGWLQYPVEGYEDSTYFQRNLKIHDQGGLVELDIDDVDYTAELTQLVYGHTIRLMKLAIYDQPLDSIGINSRSISYTWTSPEAKRLGINLRKIVSGWTLIEEGYINSNNIKKK